MKPIDVVKVLMGIRSTRDCVERFKSEQATYGSCVDYDFEELMGLATDEVTKFYIEH